jgi:glycosyltransferase involved in cell wall biosynthesis
MLSTAQVGGAPDVSVVVPTKDRPTLLSATLRSVCRQQGVSIEVVVVDDGSDNVESVESVVAELNDSRVRIVRHAFPEGVSAARNRGLAATTGTWVAFCDDDDLWAPDKILRQLRALNLSGSSWVYTGAVDINRRSAVTKGSPPPTPDTVVADLPKFNVIPGGCSGVLAARKALVQVGAFDAELGPCADWDLWLKLLRFGPPACVPEALVGYRLHPANMSLNEERMVSDFSVLRARYGTMNEATFRRYLFWWSLRSQRRRAAFRHWFAAARARDRIFPVRLLGSDLMYLLRNSAKVLLSRTRYGRWSLGRPSADAPRDESDPYVVSARHWVAQCDIR